MASSPQPDADLEDAGAGGDAGLVEQPLDLAALRVREVGAVDGRVPVVGGLWWSGDQVVTDGAGARPAGRTEVSKSADE